MPLALHLVQVGDGQCHEFVCVYGTERLCGLCLGHSTEAVAERGRAGHQAGEGLLVGLALDEPEPGGDDRPHRAAHHPNVTHHRHGRITNQSQKTSSS